MSLDEFFRKASVEKAKFNSIVSEEKKKYYSKISDLKQLITLDSIKKETLKDNKVADFIARENKLCAEKVAVLKYKIGSLDLVLHEERLNMEYEYLELVDIRGENVESFYKELRERVLERIPVLQDNLPF